MKVKELIAILQVCDQEAMVVVDGYEGGVSELETVKHDAMLELNVNEQWYYGDHEVNSETGTVPAVYLRRN